MLVANEITELMIKRHMHITLRTQTVGRCISLLADVGDAYNRSLLNITVPFSGVPRTWYAWRQPIDRIIRYCTATTNKPHVSRSLLIIHWSAPGIPILAGRTRGRSGESKECGAARERGDTAEWRERRTCTGAGLRLPYQRTICNRDKQGP